MRWEDTEEGKAYYKAYQQKWHQAHKQDPEYLERRRAQQREYRKRQREANRDQVNTAKRAWARQRSEQDPEWRRERTRKRMADEKKMRVLHPEKWKRRVRQTNLRNNYQMSLDEYDAMFEAQKGLCAICCKPETSKLRGVVKRLAVDHDHSTGKVRDLLCNACNRAIGLMRENPEVFYKAAEYLKKHKPESATMGPSSQVG
jgi:hypothetical protein